MSTPTAEASTSKTDTLALVKEAQTRQLAVINDLRRQLIQAHMDLEEYGGKDKPQEGLLKVLSAFNNPVPLNLLKQAFDDSELNAARAALKDKQIRQNGKRGDDVTLSVIETAAPATTAPAQVEQGTPAAPSSPATEAK